MASGLSVPAGLRPQAAKEAKAAGLVYVTDSVPGIRRLRRGRAFSYLKPDAKPVRAAGEIRRIARLAIPPAYRDVWICPDARGHLQATGRDARGRKQYRYHALWRHSRDDTKFERMGEFGEALPRLRRRLATDLKRQGLPREKVLAVIVSLLDATRIRIGNPEYAKDNHSFGLTTLRDRHLSFIRGRALLQFRGKGGKQHDVAIDDKRIAGIMHRCQSLPGQQLFQYLDDAGVRHALTSADVNHYLQDAMGSDFTSKDFRTWHATARAFALLSGVTLPTSERACNQRIMAVVREVAGELRNTPAVCRRSYINPAVFAAWLAGRLGKPPAAGTRTGDRNILAFLRLAHKFRAVPVQDVAAG